MKRLLIILLLICSAGYGQVTGYSPFDPGAIRNAPKTVQPKHLAHYCLPDIATPGYDVTALWQGYSKAFTSMPVVPTHAQWTQTAVSLGNQAESRVIILPNRNALIIPNQTSYALQVYDPDTDSCISKGAFGMRSITGAVVGDEVFIFPRSATSTDTVILNWRDGSTETSPDGAYGVTYSLRLPNGKILLAFADDRDVASRTLGLYDPATRSVTPSTTPVNEGSFRGLFLMPNGKVFISGYYNLRIYDPTTDTVVSDQNSSNSTRGIVTPCGKFFVCWDGTTIDIRNSDTGARIALKGAPSGITTVGAGCALPNGQILFTTSSSGAAMMLLLNADTQEFTTIPAVGDLTSPRNHLGILSNGKVLTVPGNDAYFYTIDFGLAPVHNGWLTTGFTTSQ